MTDEQFAAHHDTLSSAMAVIERDVESAVADLSRMIAVDTSFLRVRATALSLT